MKGDPNVIAGLLKVVALEAALNEQYRLDAQSFRFLKLKNLKKKVEGFGDDCSDRRREIVARIYFLGGTPAYSIGSVQDQGSVTSVFQNELAMEMALLPIMQDLCIQAWNAKDDNTRNLYEHWIKWHENEHVAWLEGQLRLIESLGESAYIAEGGDY